MKHIIAAFVMISTAALSGTALSAETCGGADPSSLLPTVRGDFEITVDPQDSEGNLIVIANVTSGASSVAAARINGVSGNVTPQTLTTIADNFLGDSQVNGPEFVQKPSGALGVVYAGPDGVHGVFRGDIPASWNDLRYDVNGSTSTSSPPAVASTSVGAYPATIPLGQNTYGQYLGACQGICYGALDFGVTTDIVAVLTLQGYTASDATQSPRDGYIFISACDLSNSCGLYEASIDNAGGFAPNSFQKLVDLDVAPTHLAAHRHPVTGTTVLFSGDGTKTISVWEQPAAGGVLKLIAKVSAAKSRHYRTLVDSKKVVLHYLGASLATEGSYTVPVTASGTKLVAGASKKISAHGRGAELVWLPAANKWAIYYRASGVFTRCWVTP